MMLTLFFKVPSGIFDYSAYTKYIMSNRSLHEVYIKYYKSSKIFGVKIWEKNVHSVFKRSSSLQLYTGDLQSSHMTYI